ncbi:MAG: DUF2007 domain-containing protein [candidate division WOR-3 bacterium]|nr:DUF2007 domain-containing protein [candidate division WOR-3 bacterium]MCX7757468.1 DUF2007 domain-containing protein [candidate division WOR-3 bacterium]MDW7988279.1 DUF2007 domain-containing protein [candidate division WOR-3 bacterium]
MKLKVVYKPDNELLALSLKALLEDAGVEVILKSYQIPWYDGIAKMMRPEWGEILVAEDSYNKAKKLIACFLSADESK